MNPNNIGLNNVEDLKIIKQLILALSAGSKQSFGDGLTLNNLVLKATEPILSKKGKNCIVVSGQRKYFKSGYCYRNAVKIMDEKGYDYVEGYAKHKKTNIKIAHAWNVDGEGNHIDFTLKNAEEHDYFGVIIPKSIVYQVGQMNGYVWYAALPFLDNL